MLKKILIFLVFFSLGVSAIAYYYWRQVTMVPDWYQSQTVKPKNFDPPTPEMGKNNTAIADRIRTTIQQKKQSVTGEIEKKSSQPLEINLSYQDFNQLISAKINQKLQSKMSQDTLTSIPTIQTKIDAQSVEIGSVINPKQLEEANLNVSQKALITKAIQYFPQLKDQSFYLGITGKTNWKNGKLSLTQDSQIRVGNLRFTIAEISRKTSIPPEKIQQLLQFNLGEFPIEDLQFGEDQVTLTINSQSTK